MPGLVESNGVNGHKSEEAVTKAFASFVVNTKESDISPEIATKLKALLLDYFGVSSAAGNAAESTPVIFKGVQAFAAAAGAGGKATVMTKGSSFAPQYAALLNAALAHTYDFDDTHAGAILHPGCSLISAALAEAETRGLSGAELIPAMAVGYEISCRIGIALTSGSYKAGFHNTGTAGVFGSVATICKLRNCDQTTVENALGLAVSRAAGSMQFLENGSWNKRLHPGFAAHDALLCVSLAQAGVLGASKPIEGKFGAVTIFSASGDPTGMIKDLGTTWSFLQTACKPFPACRMTHGCLEMTGKFKKAHPSQGAPKSIVITLPVANYPVVGLDSSNKINPISIVDGQFSCYFQTAASWLYGNNLGWGIYDYINDAKVNELAKNISITTDSKYNSLESRMKVTFEDGTEAEDEVIFPIAEPQRPFEWDTGVQKKFLGMASPVYGEEKAKEICKQVEKLEERNITEMMKFLA